METINAFENIHNLLVEKGFSKEVKGFEESIGTTNENIGFIINYKGENIEDLLTFLGWTKSESKELISSRNKGLFGTFIEWTSPEGFIIRYRSQKELPNNNWHWDL